MIGTVQFAINHFRCLDDNLYPNILVRVFGAIVMKYTFARFDHRVYSYVVHDVHLLVYSRSRMRLQKYH
jgi:hypothetical protein